MTLYIYFPDKTVNLSPLPSFTLSFQKVVKFHASFPWFSNNTEFDVTRVQVALKQIGYLSKAISYMTYPAILIPLETLSILFQSINPLFASAFAIVKIAFAALSLIFTAKWTSDGSLPQLSKDLYDFSLAADHYSKKIDSNLRDHEAELKSFALDANQYIKKIKSNSLNFETKLYNKVVFSSPTQLPDSRISRPLNSILKGIHLMRLKIGEYFCLV